MTSRERVTAMLAEPWHPEPYGKRSFLSHDELEQRIEQAITAAIKEEREACAQICERAAAVEMHEMAERTWLEGAERIRARTAK